jgi:peptide/nickel transport system substrate-binding protein
VPSGIPAADQQAVDEIATLKQADIKLTAIYQTQGDVGNACYGGTELWELCDYGGWIYAPDYYPSGEVLFAVGSSSNSGGYDNAEMQGLVADTTTTGDLALNQKNPTYGTSFAQYTATSDPFFWQPTPSGFGEVLKTITGAQAPNPLQDFNPEYITKI